MSLICRTAMVLLVVVNLLTTFISVNFSGFSLFGFVLEIAILVSSLTLMSKGFKKITVIFLFAGIGLLIYFKQPFSTWVEAAGSMSRVISILVVMQLFSIPIEIGRYSAAMRNLLSKSFKGEPLLFVFSTAITHIFSTFLSFGTIPVVVALLEDALKRNTSNYERFISSAVTRGYTLAVLWSPSAINVLLIIQATGVKWVELLVPGLILSLIGFIISYFLEARFTFSTNPDKKVATNPQPQSNDDGNYQSPYHIIAVIISLVIITGLLEHFNFVSFSQGILIAGLTVALGWLAFFVKESSFWPAVRNYWQKGLLKTVDLAPLFISMGVFSTAVDASGLLEIAQADLRQVSNFIGLWALVAVPLIMILCSLVGIHPFISIVMFGHVLTSLNLPIPLISQALCLSVGGAVSYSLSPFAGIVLTLAKFINRRAVDIAFHWNLRYGILFFIAGILFACFWGQI